MKIIADLFDTGHRVTEKLLPFAKTMFASLLQYLDDLIRHCGTSNIVVSHIVNSGAKFGVPLKTLIEWGFIVSDDFALRNSIRVPATDTSYLSHVIAALQKDAISMREKNRKIRTELAPQTAMISELVQLLRDQKIAGEPRILQSRNNRSRSCEVRVKFTLKQMHDELLSLTRYPILTEARSRGTYISSGSQ